MDGLNYNIGPTGGGTELPSLDGYPSARSRIATYRPTDIPDRQVSEPIIGDTSYDPIEGIEGNSPDIPDKSSFLWRTDELRRGLSLRPPTLGRGGKEKLEIVGRMEVCPVCGWKGLLTDSPKGRMCSSCIEGIFAEEEI